MKVWMGVGILAMLMASGLGPSLAVVAANPVQGTPVPIAGLDDANATVQDQARKGSGKSLALFGGIASALTFIAGYHYAGGAGGIVSIGLGLLPNATSSTFDAAAAATPHGVSLARVPLETWWAPLLALFYPVLLLVKFLQDPIVLGSAVVALYGLSVLRAEHAPSRRHC